MAIKYLFKLNRSLNIKTRRLTSPKRNEQCLFHERKALSQFEKRYTSKSKLRPFNVEELDYIQSLQFAITNLENKLKEENTEFAQYSLANLAQLKKIIQFNTNKILNKNTVFLLI